MRSPLRLRACVVDFERQLALREDQAIPLTAKEAELLAYLSARPGVNISKAELLQEVWDYRPGLPSNTVGTTLWSLRRKVEQDPSRPAHLVTLRGRGYRFEPLAQSA